eukprot:CAMPEP_0183746958 /NCGR_PEP_ID=MMETSP0737-20130205/67023_1 /TAXON_ID=385413 /ORGANISM="Thalassiosira miniscula, Strain CCMP1093" /LENGTH=308 /DNA_ID=CAMNT_0025982665 /DNA_START=51 /DNA_END=977 /DNA_ORIENTATION=+
MAMLEWPYEGATPLSTIASAPSGNLCVPGFTVIDAHGNPSIAQLKIFSDGNHHMALELATRRFLALHNGVQDVFYTTAPAGTVRDAFESGLLRLGNLTLSVLPNAFIGPQKVVGPLFEAGKISKPIPFARSRGSVLLVRKGNPCKISSVLDLLRSDVRVACSSPTKEKASFGVYSETLCNLCKSEGGDSTAMLRILSGEEPTTRHSGRIHHREVPQLIASNLADVAPMYYHLALRYTTIFPNHFDIIPLGGTAGDPQPGPEHKLNTYFVAVVKDNEGGWGEKFVEFMQSKEVAEIYESTGLESLTEKA